MLVTCNSPTVSCFHIYSFITETTGRGQSKPWLPLLPWPANHCGFTSVPEPQPDRSVSGVCHHLLLLDSNSLLRLRMSEWSFEKPQADPKRMQLTGIIKIDHITPIQATFQWLPRNSKIDFRILLLTCEALRGWRHHTVPRPLRTQSAGWLAVLRISLGFCKVPRDNLDCNTRYINKVELDLNRLAKKIGTRFLFKGGVFFLLMYFSGQLETILMLTNVRSIWFNAWKTYRMVGKDPHQWLIWKEILLFSSLKKKLFAVSAKTELLKKYVDKSKSISSPQKRKLRYAEEKL